LAADPGGTGHDTVAVDEQLEGRVVIEDLHPGLLDEAAHGPQVFGAPHAPVASAGRLEDGVHPGLVGQTPADGLPGGDSRVPLVGRHPPVADAGCRRHPADTAEPFVDEHDVGTGLRRAESGPRPRQTTADDQDVGLQIGATVGHPQ
jgi:hypothetical protein